MLVIDSCVWVCTARSMFLGVAKVRLQNIPNNLPTKASSSFATPFR